MIRNEYAIIETLLSEYSVSELCELMGVSTSGYYGWQSDKHTLNSYEQTRKILIDFIKTVHKKYKSYGYRRIADKIRRDIGWDISDYLCHKCCKEANIKSLAKQARFVRPGKPSHLYENVIGGNYYANKPFEKVSSDTTMINHKGKKYDLNLYVDMFNNEIVGYDLIESKSGHGKENHINALKKMLKIKKQRGYEDTETILHTDQGAVYASRTFAMTHKRDRIIRSMSRVATPTDNALIEAINGWIKVELELDFDLKNCENIYKVIDQYIEYYNNVRASYKLGYKSPVEYRLARGFL